MNYRYKSWGGRGGGGGGRLTEELWAYQAEKYCCMIIMKQTNRQTNEQTPLQYCGRPKIQHPNLTPRTT